MPNNKIIDPGRPSLASRLNAQIRDGTAGNKKTNKAEVRLFKQRIRDGLDDDAARKDTKISARMAQDIKAGRTWPMVILLVLAVCTMGNSCDSGGDGGGDRPYCEYLARPLCRDVTTTYPCLCLYGLEAVTSEADERELYNVTPTPGYIFEGGPEGGQSGDVF